MIVIIIDKPKRLYYYFSYSEGVRFFITENEFMIILDYIMTNFPNELDVYIQKAKSFAKKFQNVYPDDYYNLCEKLTHFKHLILMDLIIYFKTTFAKKMNIYCPSVFS